MERFEDARPLCTEVYECRLKAKGPEAPDSVSSLFGLAVLHDSMNLIPEAFELHKRCYDIRKVKNGFNNANTLKSMHALGVLYWKLGDSTSARDLLGECLIHRRKVLGREEENKETMKTKVALDELQYEFVPITVSR